MSWPDLEQVCSVACISAPQGNQLETMTKAVCRGVNLLFTSLMKVERVVTKFQLFQTDKIFTLLGLIETQNFGNTELRLQAKI